VISSRALIVVYALIALLALVGTWGTWGHNMAYLDMGWLAANLQFWSDTLISEASTSITIDLFFLVLAVNLWMVLEARRLGMRWVWAYIVAGILVAISVTFPLFMIHRQRALASTAAAPVGKLTAGDIAGLLVLSAGVLAFSARTFMH
jgi:hypothetical protein